MEWINVKYQTPNISGPYLISLSKTLNNGNEYVYNYYSYYDLETGKFHEYDSKKGTIGKIIEQKVIGWLKGLTNYLG
ncbi:hypothetical protein [Chryseobacterium oranimense]|uniref:hypothetical protein n=1 Tax=Chryseobacterium oranimense TaxID=421058 RepID=UPI00223661B3|nr:hypothetical protein [Chryseobacterium oranimense]